MPAHNLPDAQGERIAAAITDLIELGYIAEQEVTDLSLQWRHDGDTSVGVFITAAGRVVIEGEDMPAQKERPSKAPHTKATIVHKLLLRSRGATMAEIAKATDWQPHSIRAFLSSVRRKTGPLVREPRRSGEQAYRLISAATEQAA